MKKPKKLEIDISKKGIEKISATVSDNPKDMAEAIGVLSDIMLDILKGIRSILKRKMKTTKTVAKEVKLCDDCKKNEVKEAEGYEYDKYDENTRCVVCEKDLCKECNAYKQDYELPIICKKCFNKFPKFVQDNMEAVLRSPHEGGECILTGEFGKRNVLVFNPENYKKKGFYIFIVGHEDGSCVHYCKNKEEISEVMDEYSSEENEDLVSDVYDEEGNKYDMKISVELKKK